MHKFIEKYIHNNIIRLLIYIFNNLRILIFGIFQVISITLN